MSETLEQFVAGAILEETITVIIKEKEYKVARPSSATLIEASKYISELPLLSDTTDESLLIDVLRNAHKCGSLGDIAAVLVLGRKNLIRTEKDLFGLRIREVDQKKALAQIILDELDPEELFALITTILKGMKVDFFFTITAFLREINILKRTKETQATAHGLLSPDLPKSSE